MPGAGKKEQNENTRRIYTALKKAFPGLPNDIERVVYQYNLVSIRIRVISPKFRGKSTAEREEIVRKALKDVPDEVTEDITMQLMLTPEEAENPHLLWLEFDDPSRSYL